MISNQRLVERASAILELIEYADKRIKTREENLSKYPAVFPNLVEKYKQDNLTTKRAKERLQRSYRNTIQDLARLVTEDLASLTDDERLDAWQKENTVTPSDLETTQRVLRVTASKVRTEERKEYHLFKREGKGIQFDNVERLRETGRKVREVAQLVNSVHDEE